MTTWRGCYDEGWQDVIVPAAFAHPAKMAKGLLERILDHLFEIGAVEKGSTVLDPFGGIGTTALLGAGRGLRVICCELEPKFVALAQENVALHEYAWRAMGCPIPVIAEGDSRYLREVIATTLAVDAVWAIIASPPYAEIASGAGGLNTQPPQHPGQQGGRSPSSASQATDQRYGDSGGQMAKLPLGAVEAVVASPPFLDARRETTRSVPARHGGPAEDRHGAMPGGVGYGDTPGNLDTLEVGSVEAVVSSPPYENSVNSEQSGIDWTRVSVDRSGGPPRTTHSQGVTPSQYGLTAGQLGGEAGETFWSAASQVVRECHALLKPGGVAVWVVKAFVRHKQLVDFPGDWRRLCEHAGFETVEEVHASLVEEVTHPGLFGDRTVRTERKSFFRRLAEKKGSPRIDHEVVWIMRKP